MKTINKHLIFSFHKEGEQSFIHLFTHSFISQIGVNQAKTIIFSSHKEENNHFIFELRNSGFCLQNRKLQRLYYGAGAEDGLIIRMTICDGMVRVLKEEAVLFDYTHMYN